jgi:uncharacterized membrane protein YkvA (DUF1232 family)
MKDFAELVEEDVASYSGRNERLITEAPAFYRLLLHMLEDPDLPAKLRPMVLAAVAYFVIPSDIIPEDMQGPPGYIDDIYLCAFVAEQVRRETRSDEILARNWEGQSPVLSLVHEILTDEKDLMGDKFKLVLEFIGYDSLKKFL